MSNIRGYRELRVYQNAFEAAMKIFELTKSFPPEEKYSMVDPKRGVNVVIPRILSANLATVKAKPKKREFGWNLHFAVVICRKKILTNWIRLTI
jgi:hypothetical protein